jgi:hypothetical protein
LGEPHRHQELRLGELVAHVGETRDFWIDDLYFFN